MRKIRAKAKPVFWHILHSVRNPKPETQNHETERGITLLMNLNI